MKKILLLPLIFLFLACQDKSDRGIAEMHWDRDMCTRCVMVISDRKNSVQLEDTVTHKIYKFDDIGCMFIWVSETKASWIKDATIWVTDAKSGKWIDARTAFYTTGNVTPMSFGYSAYESKVSIDANKETIDFNEVYKRIKK